jgi:arginine utilization regulatory protein
MSKRETDAWLEALLESLELGVHAVDMMGNTVYYNRWAGWLDGLEPSEVIGKHVLNVFPSLTEETSSLLRVLRTQEKIAHEQQSYRNFRGDVVHTSNMTRPVFADGRQIGALEVAMDMTEVQHLAEQVVDLQAAVRPVLGKKNNESKKKTGASWTLADLITGSSVVQEVIEKAKKIATTSSPVLVFGATGTGKELIVQGIHNASPRAAQPFIAQNCAALPGTLLEGILFGTVRGSFTGAENRAGMFELASGGTLFLDELNSMPLDLQAKLLRVIEEQQVRRLGDNKVVPIDVRIMAAMNVDPEEALKQGNLRADLYYRVRVVTVHLPPLVQRGNDLLLLARHFIGEFNRRFAKQVKGLSSDAEQVLRNVSWQGNVRELKHAIESSMNLIDKGWIEPQHLPMYLLKEAQYDDALSAQNSADLSQSGARSLQETVVDLEKSLIMRALEDARGNLTHAAQILGVPRQTLQSKVKKYHL